MFRERIFLILVMMIVIFGLNKLSFAMICSGDNKHRQTAQAEQSESKQEAVTEDISKEPINIGNKICPVSGEKIDEKSKVTYEYGGKIYNFCCIMCIDEFKKDPEKYIKKIEEELQAESKGQSEDEGHETEMIQGAETSPQGIHQRYHH